VFQFRVCKLLSYYISSVGSDYYKNVFTYYLYFFDIYDDYNDSDSFSFINVIIFFYFGEIDFLISGNSIVGSSLSSVSIMFLWVSFELVLKSNFLSSVERHPMPIFYP